MNRPESFVAAILVCGLAVAADRAKEIDLKCDRWGEVRIGMSVREVERLFPAGLKLTRGPNCVTAEPRGEASGPSFFFREDRLLGIAVLSSGIATEEGIRVGDSSRRVRERYGKRVTFAREDPYDEKLTAIFVLPGGKKCGIRFDVKGGRVVEIESGEADEIQMVERCI